MSDNRLLADIKKWYEGLQASNSSLLQHPLFVGYVKELLRYISLPGSESSIGLWPCLDDKTDVTLFDGYYYYQDTWAARRIFEICPRYVVDVGSTALLVGIISQFVLTVSVDIRPLIVKLKGLSCVCASITELPFKNCAIEFMSSMCVIEHIGLGRYGGDLDTQGSIKAFKEVSRVIKFGGHFIFSVPLGSTSWLSFNAHRVFIKQQVLDLLKDFSLQDELFLYPEPGSEVGIAQLQSNQFCIWCAHLVKIAI